MAHKILIIDDDKGLVGVIKNILQERNHEVIFAYDGKEGLIKVENENPDLIVLDICMPLIGGYEFLRALNAQKVVDGEPMLPVIILTAKEELEEVFKLEGARGYLVKPIDPGSLVKKIEECLDSNG